MADRRCTECMALNGAHSLIHERYGNGGGGNRPCRRGERLANLARHASNADDAQRVNGYNARRVLVVEVTPDGRTFVEWPVTESVASVTVSRDSVERSVPSFLDVYDATRATAPEPGSSDA